MVPTEGHETVGASQQEGHEVKRTGALCRGGSSPLQSQAERIRVVQYVKKRLHGDLTAIFEYLKRAYQEAGEGLFVRNCSNRTRSKGYKQKEGKFILDVKKILLL